MEQPDTQRAASLASKRSEGKAGIATQNSWVAEATGLNSPFQQGIQA